MVNKGKLIPVRVPWRVSFSTPFLTVKVTEFDGQEIEFVATFWSETIGSDERKVKLSFDDLSLVRIKSSGENDRAISIENFDYDLSEITDLPKINEDIAAWGKRYADKWNETGICPDPRMYEVIGSQKFISIIPPEAGYKHYLVIGEMMALELLCKEWTWEAGETIDWFKNG